MFFLLLFFIFLKYPFLVTELVGFPFCFRSAFFVLKTRNIKIKYKKWSDFRGSEKDSKKLSDFYIFFQCVAMNIESWLKICILVYSQILLNLHSNDGQLFLHLSMDDHHLGYIKKLHEKKTLQVPTSIITHKHPCFHISVVFTHTLSKYSKDVLECKSLWKFSWCIWTYTYTT